MLRRVLERVSKRRRKLPLPTPGIIDTIPLPAEDVRSDIEDLVRTRMAYGNAYGAVAGKWYRVRFGKSLISPSVTAVAKWRAGDFIKRTIERVGVPAPKEIPRVSVPGLKEITRVKRVDFNSPEYCETVAVNAQTRVWELYLEGKFGVVPWPMDIIFTWMVSTFAYWFFYAAMYGIGFILNVLWDSFLQPQIDKVRDSINEVVGDLFGKLMGQVNYVRDRANEVIAESHANLQGQIDHVADRANEILEDFYEMTGVPGGFLLTPVHVRNVTSTGFEFQSFGETRIFYIAVGRKEVWGRIPILETEEGFPLSK